MLSVILCKTGSKADYLASNVPLGARGLHPFALFWYQQVQESAGILLSVGSGRPVMIRREQKTHAGNQPLLSHHEQKILYTGSGQKAAKPTPAERHKPLLFCISTAASRLLIIWWVYTASLLVKTLFLASRMKANAPWVYLFELVIPVDLVFIA